MALFAPHPQTILRAQALAEAAFPKLKVIDIEMHQIILPYQDWARDVMMHFYGPNRRTIYVVRTNSDLVGLGENEDPLPKAVVEKYIGTSPFEWVADETATVEGRSAYLWIVPAKTAGTWTLEVGGNKSTVQISQTFQKIEGNVQRGDRLSPLNGSVRGDEIRFSTPDGQGGRREYVGRITGERMEGRSGSDQWSATRTAKSG